MTFPTLESAIRCAIRNETTWADLKPSRWAETYHCTPSDVERVWKAELTKETNANPVEGK